MLDTGVRQSELVKLTLAALNLADDEARVVGKGGKERSVFFAPAAAELLRRWVAIRRDEPRSLFWLSFEGVKMLFVRIQKEAGLAVFHPHQLRHTCATNLLAAGAHTHSARVFGHASILITERYLSMSNQDLKVKHTAASPSTD